jgi:hypothetical protein
VERPAGHDRHPARLGGLRSAQPGHTLAAAIDGRTPPADPALSSRVAGSIQGRQWAITAAVVAVVVVGLVAGIIILAAGS